MACESTYFGLEEFTATHQMCDLLEKSRWTQIHWRSSLRCVYCVINRCSIHCKSNFVLNSNCSQTMVISRLSSLRQLWRFARGTPYRPEAMRGGCIRRLIGMRSYLRVIRPSFMESTVHLFLVLPQVDHLSFVEWGSRKTTKLTYIMEDI